MKSIAIIIALSLGLGLTACKKEEVKPVADYTVKAAGETVRIEVSSNGYTPKSIGVRKGQAVKLQFLRKDANNCGDGLVFPSLNIKKQLPVGEVVEIDVTPDATGEIKFACGMDMLRGKLIVTD